MTTNDWVEGEVSDAEFDDYADHYDAGMGHRVKRMLGESAVTFIDVKVRWLKRALAVFMQRQAVTNELKLLDFGCGNGILLERVQQLGIPCQPFGCDSSQGMLLQARKRLGADAPNLALIRGGKLDFDHDTFDVVILSAVLHHVAPPERSLIYQELRRVLTPGGLCIVFEHNPYHPVVRYIVATTPIDRNAELLRPRDVRRGMQAAGFVELKTRWLMFCPPRWKWAHAAEPWLESLPMGGQYVVMGAKASL